MKIAIDIEFLLRNQNIYLFLERKEMYSLHVEV